MTEDPQRQRKLQQHRLRMTLLSITNSALQSGVLVLYAWDGQLPWSVLLGFFVAAVGSTAGFALVVRQGWNLRFNDPGMLKAQIVTACLVQLGGLMAAPQLWVLFLMALCVTFNFAMMNFEPRQFTLAWLLLGASMGLALFLIRGRIAPLPATDFGIFVLWLFFVLCLRQLTAIGAQFSTLRHKLVERNRDLSASLDKLEQLAGQQRLVERERIARELHDTLLQGIQGLILRFQSVAERIPPDGPARQMMEEALEKADQVLVEGRDQLAMLRVASSAGADLGGALSTAGEELSLDYRVAFQLALHGQPRELEGQVGDEAYRVAREALLNAFQHAGATQIDAVLTYGSDMLRVEVRDNGAGIDAQILADGCSAGHSGLPAMRERARRLGGYLSIRHEEGSGTVVELSVPSALAYRAPQPEQRRPLDWLRTNIGEF